MVWNHNEIASALIRVITSRRAAYATTCSIFVLSFLSLLVLWMWPASSIVSVLMFTTIAVAVLFIADLLIWIYQERLTMERERIEALARCKAEVSQSSFSLRDSDSN
jgi:uncharacterized membrane protein